MSFLELLITLAIISVLVGVVSPMIQNEIRKARSARTANEMEEIKKLLAQHANRNGLLQPYIPGTPHSPPKFLRPEHEVKVTALIPKSLPEVPKDSWGEDIYRFGNYLMSNGDNGLPGDADDVSMKVGEFPEQIDPDTGTVLMDRLEVEATYQSEYLALLVQKHKKKTGTPPEGLWEIYDEVGQGGPSDPWGNPYVYVYDPNTRIIASKGPDGRKGTDDDITADWDRPTRYEDAFSLGVRNWVKIFPIEKTPASTKIQWIDQDGPESRWRFDGSQGGVQSAAWVKIPPATADMGPYQRVSIKLTATRTEGTFIWGLMLNYSGKNTGIRGTMILQGYDGDATLHLDNAAPGMSRTWYGGPAPKSYAGVEVNSDEWQFQGTLEIIPGSPPQVRFRVLGGGHDGVITEELRLPPKKGGAAGLFVATEPPGGKFIADFDNLIVERTN
jgi:type II secretory pathway pseudopilin PulG